MWISTVSCVHLHAIGVEFCEVVREGLGTAQSKFFTAPGSDQNIALHLELAGRLFASEGIERFRGHYQRRRVVVSAAMGSTDFIFASERTALPLPRWSMCCAHYNERRSIARFFLRGQQS